MSKLHPRFGLNTEVEMTKFDYVNNQFGESVLVEVHVHGKKFWQYYNWPTSVRKGNKESTAPADVKPAKLATKATLKHIAAAMSSEKAVDAMLSASSPQSFEELYKTMRESMPEDLSSRALDVFLSYQWNIPKGQVKTFLELPRSVKHGDFLVPAQGRGFKWNKDEEAGDDDVALKYVKEGKEHPFRRTGWFMQSNFAQSHGNEVAEDMRSARAEVKDEAPAAQAEDDDLPF